MARVIDPVCGMTIDSDEAAAKSKDAAGRDVYFCSVDCQRQFEAHPEKYDERAVSATSGADSIDRDVTGHDAPRDRDRAGGIPTPRFGSAGSGGAEFERLPGEGDTRP